MTSPSVITFNGSGCHFTSPHFAKAGLINIKDNRVANVKTNLISITLDLLHLILSRLVYRIEIINIIDLNLDISV
jgi:hypothetical protein